MLVCSIRMASKSEEATCKIRAIRAIRVQEKTHIIRVIIIDHESHRFHSKFAVDCDVSRINQEIWNKN